MQVIDCCPDCDDKPCNYKNTPYQTGYYYEGGHSTGLSFDLSRNYYIKNVVLFEENSILPLPERLEASGVESVWGEVSQESPTNR